MAFKPKIDKKAKAIADFKKTKETAVTTQSGKARAEELIKLRTEFKGMAVDLKKPTEVIPSGSWVFDRCIGDGSGTGRPGGVPRGFIGELYGAESCGKTTLALTICREAQKQGLLVVYVDFEKTIKAQRPYIKRIGLDIEDENTFFLIQPRCYEDGADAVINALIRVKPALIIIDSLATAIPREFIANPIDSPAQVGKHAKLTTMFIGKLNDAMEDANAAVIVINQYRSNIKSSQYDEGPKLLTTGGLAIKYAFLWRCELKPTSDKEEINTTSVTLGKKEVRPVNQKIKMFISKNKFDSPYRSSYVYITFGTGIDNVRSIQELAENKKVIKAAGAWFKYESPNDNTFSFNINGRTAVTAYLKSHSDVLEDITSGLFIEADDEEYEAARMSGEIEEEANTGKASGGVSAAQRAVRKLLMEEAGDGAADEMALPD